jgi:hypothetical protein
LSDINVGRDAWRIRVPATTKKLTKGRIRLFFLHNVVKKEGALLEKLLQQNRE